MSITLFAQPYDLAAAGFYFEDIETFQTKSKALRNDYGEEVEEYEIQFIDGDALDCALFKALSVHQGNVAAFLETAIDWEDWEKIMATIAVGEVMISTLKTIAPVS